MSIDEKQATTRSVSTIFGIGLKIYYTKNQGLRTPEISLTGISNIPSLDFLRRKALRR
jgi:hypothetical protein